MLGVVPPTESKLKSSNVESYLTSVADHSDFCYT